MIRRIWRALKRFAHGHSSFTIGPDDRGILRRYVVGTRQPWSTYGGDDRIGEYKQVYVPEDDADEITYYLGKIESDDATDVWATLSMIEIHELSHWAHDEPLPHHEDGDSEAWDRVLIDVVDYCHDDVAVTYDDGEG